jgi:hypothetical protein
MLIGFCAAVGGAAELVKLKWRRYFVGEVAGLFLWKGISAGRSVVHGGHGQFGNR